MRFTILFFSFCTGFSAFAQTISTDSRICDDMGAVDKTRPIKQEFTKLLRERKFKVLESEFNDRYQQIQGDSMREMAVYALFSFADGGDLTLEPFLNQWVRESPSYWAYLARAEYWAGVGWKKRGNKFSSETSEEQFEGLHEGLEKAVMDIDEAMKINPNNPMAYAVSILIVRAIAGRAEVDKVLAKSIKLAPGNFVVRHRALFALAPRWGGSFEAMDKVVDGAERAKLPKVDVTRLRYQAARERGDHFRFEKNLAAALEQYDVALNFCDGRGTLRSIVQIQAEQKNWPALEKASTELIRAWPEHAYAHEQRAWAREKLGRMKEALPDFERAAELGGNWARNRLGMMHIDGKDVPRDVAKARIFLELAAANGYKNAQENLVKLNREQPRN